MGIYKHCPCIGALYKIKSGEDIFNTHIYTYKKREEAILGSKNYSICRYDNSNDKDRLAEDTFFEYYQRGKQVKIKILKFICN